MAGKGSAWVVGRQWSRGDRRGALAKVAPHIVSLDAMLEAISDQWNDDLKVASAKTLTRRPSLPHCSPLKTGPAQKLPDSIPSGTTSGNFSRCPVVC